MLLYIGIIFLSSLLLINAQENCGIVDVESFNSINTTAKSTDYPWIGLVLYKGDNYYRCAATLISERYLISVAHCFIFRADVGPYGVVLGEWYQKNKRNSTNCLIKGKCSKHEEEYKIEEVVVHPLYRRSSKDINNDVALIRLVDPVDISGSIKPICMPHAKEQSNGLVDHDLEYVNWDYTSENPIKYKAFMKVISNDICSNYFGVNNLGTAMCGKCSIESRSIAGSPLMRMHYVNDKPHHYVLLAITISEGPLCEDTVPVVLEDIECYINWIKYNMYEY